MGGPADFVPRATSTTDSILNEVLSERLRQVNRHGSGTENDDEHSEGQIARAALNYTAAACLTLALEGKSYDAPPPLERMGFAIDWPWDRKFWKPGLPRRMLIKAMALLCAEVERIDRAEARR